MRRFPATERVLGCETVRYRDLPKTRLFPTTEPVLPPFPTTPTTGFPYTGRRGGWGSKSRFSAQTTTFLVLTALNSVLPELVVLIRI